MNTLLFLPYGFEFLKGRATPKQGPDEAPLANDLHKFKNELKETTMTPEEALDEHANKVMKIHEEAELLYPRVTKELEDLKETIFAEGEKLHRNPQTNKINSQDHYNFYWHTEFYPLTRISEKVDIILERLSPYERTPMPFSPNIVTIEGAQIPFQDIINRRTQIALPENKREQLNILSEKQEKLLSMFRKLRSDFTQYYKGDKYKYEEYSNQSVREIAQYDGQLMRQIERS